MREVTSKYPTSENWKRPMQTTSPYSTVIVLELIATASGQARDEILTILKDTLISAPATSPANFPQPNGYSTLVKDLLPHSSTIVSDDFISGGFIFSETRTVKWDLSAPPATDTINILVSVSLYRKYLCLHISDGETRSTIEREIKTNPSNFPILAQSHLINPKILEAAFLQDAEIKALWLAGGHKRTAVKANAKLLNGDNLEYALDPLADQTFIARSARAQISGALSYGVTPRRSAIWRGPNSNFDEYTNDIARIIERIDTIKTTFSNSTFKPAIPILMNTLENFSGVNSAYDFGLAEQENMENRFDRKLIQILNSLYEIELNNGNSTNQELSLKVTLIKDRTKTITFDIIPDIPFGSSKVSFVVSHVPAPPFKKLIKSLLDNPEIWKCWYQSYHTIVAGQLCSAKRRNSPFNDWIWFDFENNKNFDITKEKPDIFSQIWTTPNESSLFTWCIKSASGQLGNTNAFGIPGLPLLSNSGNVWLYCDDNSREIADFVYFYHDGNKSILALIHAKGAHSKSKKRKAVPTPYELVSAQAIKNVIDLENERLMTRIRSRINNSTHKIWNSPWIINSPPTGTASNLIRELSNNNAKTELKIIILQPHVLAKNYFTNNTKQKERPGIGSEQLRTLLHGLKISAMGVNASLHVVADGT